MDRRSVLVAIPAFVGTTLAALSIAAQAQRQTIPFIGFLNAGSPGERAHLVEAFREGLKEGGYIDGQDVAIEYRWGEGYANRLPGLAKELVERRVAVIVATGGSTAAFAAKSATSTIPIVFTAGIDPVKAGLVASLSRPGGNMTGITNIAESLHAKQLQILRELLPSAKKIAYLVDPTFPGAKLIVNDIQAASLATTTKPYVVNASNNAEISAAFATIKKGRADAVIVTATGGLLMNQRDYIVALAARNAIPASYPFREFVVAGGLMSYGPYIADGYRQAGRYAARILKGAKAADLPVIQATKIELVVNLKTAKKLGVAVPRDFLAHVDEVIE